MQEAEPLPIVEDDQQLYDWGIEHRLDQYYGGGGTLEQQQQYQYQQAAAKAAGYVLPDHVQQQENAYLVSVNGDQKTVDGPAALQAAHSRQQMVVKTESSRRSFAASSRHPNIKPNGTGGVPGRRPMLPTVDMDANELMKVERKRARNRVAASKCRMRKLERIAVLDQQANHLRAENEQLAKLADKLRSQVYSLKQELVWHINNGCRIDISNVDRLDDFTGITVEDKATETTTVMPVSSSNRNGLYTTVVPPAAADYDNYDNSPDSTTTNISVKTEPGIYDEVHNRRASI